MESLVAPIITGVVTLTVCLINNAFQTRKTRDDFQVHFEKTNAMIEYKLDELSKRVDKHNSVIERTYKLEQEAAVMEEQIKVANHRIEDLEKDK